MGDWDVVSQQPFAPPANSAPPQSNAEWAVMSQQPQSPPSSLQQFGQAALDQIKGLPAGIWQTIRHPLDSSPLGQDMRYSSDPEYAKQTDQQMDDAFNQSPSRMAGGLLGQAANAGIMGLLGEGISGASNVKLSRPKFPAIHPELERAIEKIPVAGKTFTGAYGVARYLANPAEDARIPIQKGAPAPTPGSRLLPDAAPEGRLNVAGAPPPKPTKAQMQRAFRAPEEAQVISGLLTPPKTMAGVSGGLLAPEGSIAVPPVPGTQGLTGRYQQIGGDFAQNIAANAAEKDRAFASHLSSKGVKPEEFSNYTPQQIEELRKEVNSTYGKKYSKSRRGDDAFKSDVLNMMQTTRSAGGGLL